MGAWGTGPFENDGALDFLGDLSDMDVRDISEHMVNTFSEACEGDDEEFIDSDLGSSVIAAAELLAAVLGRPHAEMKADGEDEDSAVGILAEWAQDDGRRDKTLASPKTRALATKAVKRVLDSEVSELAQLWLEDDEADPADAKAWKAGVQDLLKRLEK